MRRTANMVLGLALIVLAAIADPSALLALTRTIKPVRPVSSTLPAHRRAGKSPGRSSTPKSSAAANRASSAHSSQHHTNANRSARNTHSTQSAHNLRSSHSRRSHRFRATPSTTQASTIADAAAAATGQAVERTASFSRRAATRAIMPAPLRGSLDSLTRQNSRADEEGLERIEDEADLADRIAQKILVPIPVSAELTVNTDLPEAHRYCRPWTARFLADIAQAHAAQFHQPLYVSSAVRTVEYQKRLMHINGNAAAAEGDIVSPHLTGATIDIAKSSLGRQQVGWMRSWLLPLQLAGKIDVEEEFHQSCFHITVYNNYVSAHTLSPALRARTLQADPGQAAPDQPQPDAAPRKPIDLKSRPAQNMAAATPTIGR